MQNKYLCIHGHFYQPPRENAWLEAIEQQSSAAPFHDWNERINFECYATNAAARILDNDRKIINIVNNYSHISFNMGATLLSWLATADPTTYALIQDADRQSQQLFSGHGNAIAQVFSHIIMPLANERDQKTQVIWGLKDFEHRFGRASEGMWLAETAANTESLEALAAQGVKYTILAPRQMKALRKIGAENWHFIHNENFDTRRPYLCRLPSGRAIALFFYDGGRSQGVAFEGLLNSGKAFAKRLTSGFSNSDEPELVHIATDGESYGHHHRHGEMALADCLNFIIENSDVKLTNYGEFLEKYPPQYEAQIHENSSWSCAHGVERWRSDCGCNAGGGYGKWHQRWRAPLRHALNWLRDQLIPIYEQNAAKYVHDVWTTRDAYIQLLLDRTEETVDEFVNAHQTHPLSKRERTHLFRLLEMQRQAILMFTSCGWFFDEVSGIETNQIMQYACRAIDYARQVADVELENEFLKRLEQAPSNMPDIKTAAGSYQQNVVPSRVSLVRVGMHYAASSLFEKYPKRLEFFNYVATSECFERFEAGHNVLALGRTTVRSKITHSEKHFSFVVLYFGQLNIIGNISLNMEKQSFDDLLQKISIAFHSGNLGDVLNLMQHFEGERFTFDKLFKEKKQRLINRITNRSLQSVEASFRRIYHDNYQLMSSILASGELIPDAYRNTILYVLEADLKNFFNKESLEISELNRILGEFRKWNLAIRKREAFELAASERIFHEIQRMERVGIPLSQLSELNDILKLLQAMKIELDSWKSQNLYFYQLQRFKTKQRAYLSDEWRDEFLELGDLLQVKT